MIAVASDLALPAPFEDCRNYLLDDTMVRSAISARALLTPEQIEAGIDGILGKWGPGDRRAAASLWTQGYFLRALRPLLAYGILRDHWFALDVRTAQAALSDMSTIAGFRFMRSPGHMQALQLAFDHIDAIASVVSGVSKTSPRLHRSNAGYILNKALGQILPFSMKGDQALYEEVDGVVRGFSDKWGLKFHRDADGDLKRSICCLRYNLAGLKLCKTACPIRAPNGAET
ncbi:hypothetical protein HGP17_15150 [Rhizobium sp. P38BS-XIX]|uniref:hypothetical protein n=1 Tax=Rhizobium sp. P38BS-XIX TaxID=2726740 RepID=UPI001456D5B5|nr:hypothetical protein [Rhizobium sp. P38BS-XIX]NLR98150.1 hypothetical protein [Rhizobium sp. P38BS-XIX]